MHKINSSVGRGGRNLDGDVVVVQTLLNRHVVPPVKLLVVDGVAGHKTVSAIVGFQHRIGIGIPDGKVDPSGRTFDALCSAPMTIYGAHLHPLDFLTFSKISHYMLARLASVEPRKQGLQIKDSSQRQTIKGTLPPVSPGAGKNAIAWGAKVSPEFKKRVIEICRDLEMSPDYLMTCMAFESGESFRADQPNLNGGSAIGLIQFTKVAIDDLNERYHLQPRLTRRLLGEMSNVEQLEFVRRYFLPYKRKLRSLEDTYMVIIAPVCVGRGPDGAVYEKKAKTHPENYEQNKGLDKNRDGIITLRECSVVLMATYKRGLSRGYYG